MKRISSKFKAIFGFIAIGGVAAAVLTTTLFLKSESVDNKVGTHEKVLNSSVGPKTTIEYSDIKYFEKSEYFEYGETTTGFADGKFFIGDFSDTELGNYHCYVHGKIRLVLIIRDSTDTTYVFNMETLEKTQIAASTIQAKMPLKKE